jgi:esterase/lipase superfamily enzyme
MRALEDLNGLDRITAVAFAAPDVQAIDLASVALHVSASIRLRVYYSHNDLALRLSQRINQNVRLGEGVESLPPGPPTLSSYDASNVATRDAFGHGYFANTEPVAEDLNQFFGLGNPVVIPALKQVQWLSRRDAPTLDFQESLMEGPLACTVASDIVI